VPTAHRTGYTFKYQVRQYLASKGIMCRDSGTGTAGDDLSTEHVSIECKNHKSIDLAAFMDQTVKNAGTKLPVLIVKRRGKGTPQAYAVLELCDLAELIG